MRCPRRRRPGLAWVVCAAGVVVWSGCAGPAEPPKNPAPAQLRSIIQAYDIALYKKGPPRGADDLKPFLKELEPQQDPEAILRSPNDGLPFEVVWGVRLDHESDIGAVLAYEKNGSHGKRYVITVARLVKELTDAEFQQASFARGHRPAKGK